MNKRFLNAILFGALFVASTSTFVSCKDYDDDIKHLQEQIDAKAATSSLDEKLKGLQTELASARTELTNAKTTAQEAQKKAEEALKAAQAKPEVSKAEIEALQNEVKQAKESLTNAAKKLEQIDNLQANIEALNKKLVELEKKIDVSGLKKETEKALKELNTKVDEVIAKSLQVVGHRLTSVTLIPTFHINGIPAIEVQTVVYTPQVKKANAAGATGALFDHQDAPAAKPRYVSSSANTAVYQLSPSMGIRKADIGMPEFEVIKSKNLTRAAGEVLPKLTATAYEVKDGKMTVNFNKAMTDFIGALIKGREETFYMAAVKVPVSEKYYTEAEKAAKEKVYVTSEYSRIEETLIRPYLANAAVDFTKPITGVFADEVQKKGDKTIPVHFRDSMSVYKSRAGEQVDVEAKFDEGLDLKKLVTVCYAPNLATNHAAHKQLVNYADYGLAFRFYIPQTAYITKGGPEGNSNKTDQQQFAKLDSHENGILSSKVYTINGKNESAIGREPIVRVELIDTKNGNALVAVRYLKVKWTKEEPGVEPIPDKNLGNIAVKDSVFTCANYISRLLTKQMNEQIYAAAQEGGMSKEQFHKVYTKLEKVEGDGTVKELVNSEEGVDSYNVLWTITHKEIVTKYNDWASNEDMKFQIKVKYVDPTKTHPNLVFTMTRGLTKPEIGIYTFDDIYWAKDSHNTIYNINPVVYGSKEPNPAWNLTETHNPTANIYTDLLNGFKDNNNPPTKPKNGAANVVWVKDNGKNVKFGDKFTATSVRFVFDAAKLKTDAYKYNYFDSNLNKFVKMNATVSADGATLSINGEKAAEIVNAGKNFRDPSETTYNIRLIEANPSHDPYSGDKPTNAAKALIGRNIPVKMVANLCGEDEASKNATYVTVYAYDVYIIKPVTVEGALKDAFFVDAVQGGDTIKLQGKFTYRAWNSNKNGERYEIAKNGVKISEALWNYYEVQEPNWKLDRVNDIRTNLKLVGNKLTPVEGYKEGVLPENREITYDKAKNTLVFHNYSGSPVEKEWKLYIPVEFGYKWASKREVVEITVKPNAGTPNKK